jgi:thiamine pyrophosphokinase
MYFSVFSLVNRCGAVTITGGKYPLEGYPLAFAEPRAVSNEYAGRPVTISVAGGAVAVVETPKNS